MQLFSKLRERLGKNFKSVFFNLLPVFWRCQIHKAATGHISGVVCVYVCVCVCVCVCLCDTVCVCVCV